MFGQVFEFRVCYKNLGLRSEEIMAELFLEELGDTDNFTLIDEPRSHRPDRG